MVPPMPNRWRSKCVDGETTVRRLQGFRIVRKQRRCGKGHLLIAPVGAGVGPRGPLMRIGRQVFWLRGHSLPFRPSRSAMEQWFVVWKGASPVTAAQPLPNCPPLCVVAAIAAAAGGTHGIPYSPQRVAGAPFDQYWNNVKPSAVASFRHRKDA